MPVANATYSYLLLEMGAPHHHLQLGLPEGLKVTFTSIIQGESDRYE